MVRGEMGRARKGESHRGDGGGGRGHIPTASCIVERGTDTAKYSWRVSEKSGAAMYILLCVVLFSYFFSTLSLSLSARILYFSLSPASLPFSAVGGATLIAHLV